MAACLNCGASLDGPYCAQCGQAAGETDPTFRRLLRETIGELTQLDGKVFRTLATLFARPGELTRDVLAGRRARWLPPLRIYLICSVAFYVSAQLMETLTGRSPRQVARVSLSNTDRPGPLTPEERQRVAEGLPGRVFGLNDWSGRPETRPE